MTYFRKKPWLIGLGIFIVINLSAGVFAASNLVLNSGNPVDLAAGAQRVTTCDNDVFVDPPGMTFDPVQQKYLITTISVSNVSQLNGTGCGNWVMELAAGYQGGFQITSWAIPVSNTESKFYFGGTNSGTGMARTVLTPIDPTKLQNISIQMYPGLSCAEGGDCALGDTGPGGGTVFYAATTPFLNQATGTYMNYLEVAPSGSLPNNSGSPTAAGTDPKYQMCSANTSPPAGWGYGVQYKLLDDIGYGAYNTNRIYNNYSLCNTAGLALKIVKDYRGGGKNDWFLPSLQEQQILYDYAFANSVPGWSNTYYWTSSNFDSSNPGVSQYAVGSMYGVSMGTGSGTRQLTDSGAFNRIRVIRAF